MDLTAAQCFCSSFLEGFIYAPLPWTDSLVQVWLPLDYEIKWFIARWKIRQSRALLPPDSFRYYTLSDEEKFLDHFVGARQNVLEEWTRTRITKAPGVLQYSPVTLPEPRHSVFVSDGLAQAIIASLLRPHPVIYDNEWYGTSASFMPSLKFETLLRFPAFPAYALQENHCLRSQASPLALSPPYQPTPATHLSSSDTLDVLPQQPMQIDEDILPYLPQEEDTHFQVDVVTSPDSSPLISSSPVSSTCPAYLNDLETDQDTDALSETSGSGKLLGTSDPTLPQSVISTPRTIHRPSGRASPPRAPSTTSRSKQLAAPTSRNRRVNSGARRLNRKPGKPVSKGVMSCYFCRKRKIACISAYRKDPERMGEPCEPCKKHEQECVYPTENRRGMRRFEKEMSVEWLCWLD